MKTSHAHEVSILCLSWINQELRREVARREMQTPPARFSKRLITGLVAGVTSGISLFTLKLFDL